jgi:CheY-like chemotaxis protein
MTELFPGTILENKEHPKKRILIVDDREDLLQSLIWLFEGEGYIVSSAKDGQEFLDMLEKGKFDLAIVDNNMPLGISGIKALEKINNDPKYASFKELPVILNSSTINSDIERTVQGLNPRYVCFEKGRLLPSELLKLAKEKLLDSGE